MGQDPPQIGEEGRWGSWGAEGLHRESDVGPGPPGLAPVWGGVWTLAAGLDVETLITYVEMFKIHHLLVFLQLKMNPEPQCVGLGWVALHHLRLWGVGETLRLKPSCPHGHVPSFCPRVHPLRGARLLVTAFTLKQCSR